MKLFFRYILLWKFHYKILIFQAQELRAYLKGLGAEISEEKSPKGIEDDLHKIIGVCDACFREGHEQEVEEVLNDIVSIMVLIPLERAENLILAFCEKVRSIYFMHVTVLL